MKKFRFKLTIAFAILITISVFCSGLVATAYLFVRQGEGLKGIGAVIYELWAYYLVGLFILITVAAIISYHLAEGMIKPLKHIMIVARQISHMNYGTRVKVGSKDEFGQLGEAINHMAANLEIQMKQILENEHRLESVLGNMSSGVIMIDREHNIVLLNRAAEHIFGVSAHDLLTKPYDDGMQHLELIQTIQECIAYRQPIKDELIVYKPTERILEINLAPVYARFEWIGVVIVLHDISDIRRLEKMRSEFVANVSHELKTPVASVQGFAETLLRGALDDKETATSFLQIIYDESERLNRLINDILELSKIESKSASLDYAPIQMSQLVKTATQIFETEAEKKGVSIEQIIDEGIYIEANEDRLRQILINLISNGINYMPEGGRLTIKVEPIQNPDDAEYDKVKISIADTGIGIPRVDLPRIFERFYLVDKARSRQSGGTGLGLSIVKHLVELHNGSISVESELGLGTEFHIVLPVIQEI